MGPVLRARTLLLSLGLLLPLVLWLSLALGPVSLPLGDTLRVIPGLLGLVPDDPQLAQAALIVGQLRLPRALLGLAVTMPRCAC